MSDCPVPGCGQRAQGEMCRRHWFQVPKPVRDKVWRTWKAWSADMADGEKMRAYRAARDEARELVS